MYVFGFFFFLVNFVYLLKFDISIIILKNIYTTFKNDMLLRETK
jgi:hypothetical protein